MTGISAFGRSLVIVGVAELFDKTWFMGFLLALRHNKVTVFAGSLTALVLHTVLAAALGYAFARLLSPYVLHFMAALVFAAFTLLYAKDWYYADPEADAIANGKEEAAGDIELVRERTGDAAEHEGHMTSESETGDTDGGTKCMAKWSDEWFVLTKSFMGVFIAEWGDRTQIAMIGQHASQPLVPVFLGSVVAFALLTFSAVGAASMLKGQKLSERLIYGIASLCFAVFAVLALKDGFTALDASDGA